MMMEKMTSITTDQNEIISSIQKLNPKAGDVLMFYIKTDEYGTPIMDLDVVRQTEEMIGNILEDTGVKNVASLFLMDKICLFSIENTTSVINELKNCISYIQEAIDKVRDIENGKSEENFCVADMRLNDSIDAFKRVL